ncbi:hypothetical protein SynBIOSE41_02883 [Synechococcus sp. BIOS-E4-1]|nr:hypothetical protein SynBIOSE41_02883 [Synechococcus sp. BIOS-E4-1]
MSSTFTIKDGHGWLALGTEGLLACTVSQGSSKKTEAKTNVAH